MSEKSSERNTQNHLLLQLPESDFKRLSERLEAVELPFGKYLFHAEEPIEYLYFPSTASASLIAMSVEGQCVEAGIIALMGAETSNWDCMIQIGDGGHRLKSCYAVEEFKRGGAFQEICLRYFNTFFTQVCQTALCNRIHSVEQRLSRWLLMCHDRVPRNSVHLTQEYLALMLGTHRPTVTTSALLLQSAGFIKYRRGTIKILDREGLKNLACDCYDAVRREELEASQSNFDQPHKNQAFAVRY